MDLVFILFESCWRSCHILYLLGELSTADALQTEYTAAKAGGIDLVNFVNTMIVARAVKENFDKQEWAPMLTKLQHSDGGYQCFKDLSKDDAAALQKRLLLEHILGFAKVEPDKAKKAECTKVEEALGNMRRLVHAVDITGDFIMDSQFKEEFEGFRSVLFASQETDETKIANAERYKDMIMQKKDHLFHKCLSVFATGIAARVQADKCWSQIHQDSARAITLNEICAQVKRSKDPGLQDFILLNTTTGEPIGIRLPQEAWVLDTGKKFLAIPSEATEVFKEKHQANMGIVKGFLDKTQKNLEDAFLHVFEAAVEKATTQTEDALEKHVNNADNMQGNLSKVWTPVEVLQDSTLAVVKDIGGKDQYEQCIRKAESLRTHLTKMKSSVSFLVQLFSKDSQADFLSQQCRDCMDGLEGLQNVCQATGCKLAVKQLTDIVQKHFARGLRAFMALELISMAGFVKALTEERPAEEIFGLAAQRVRLKKKQSEEEHPQVETMGICKSTPS